MQLFTDEIHTSFKYIKILFCYNGKIRYESEIKSVKTVKTKPKTDLTNNGYADSKWKTSLFSLQQRNVKGFQIWHQISASNFSVLSAFKLMTPYSIKHFMVNAHWYKMSCVQQLKISLQSLLQHLRPMWGSVGVAWDKTVINSKKC